MARPVRSWVKRVIARLPDRDDTPALLLTALETVYGYVLFAAVGFAAGYGAGVVLHIPAVLLAVVSMAVVPVAVWALSRAAAREDERTRLR